MKNKEKTKKNEEKLKVKENGKEKMRTAHKI